MLEAFRLQMFADRKFITQFRAPENDVWFLAIQMKF